MVTDISYKIYGCEYYKGWKLLNVVYSEEAVEEYIDNFDDEDYYELMVIQYNKKLNMDTPYKIQEVNQYKRMR